MSVWINIVFLKSTWPAVQQVTYYSRKRYSFKLHVFDDDIDSHWATNFTFRRKRMRYTICIVSGKDTMRLVHNQCAYTHIPNICSMTVTPRGLGVVVLFITHCGWDGANLSILKKLIEFQVPDISTFLHKYGTWYVTLATIIVVPVPVMITEWHTPIFQGLYTRKVNLSKYTTPLWRCNTDIFHPSPKWFAKYLTTKYIWCFYHQLNLRECCIIL